MSPAPHKIASTRDQIFQQCPRYESALTFARHVLAGTGRTFQSGDHRAQTFLIRTPDVVEHAVRSILQDGLAQVAEVRKKGLQLGGSTVTLNPDLVFGSTATGDVKYKLLGKDWKRSDLYQAITFATGYRVNQASIVLFTSGAHPIPEPLQVGNVTLTVLAWDCSQGTSPEVAAQSLVEDTRAWFDGAVSPQNLAVTSA